ncbi:nicotinate-nucleotide adenylyltransferase [Desulfatirhabdium butyrativorans]|uniref:nicotinate-nucleotide adenylyltransferase n=1 Tax=Desulfatirhabdium butyrativorans TaxID=340467 RepID=UPI00146FB569|nr:nicotinate-nucleotide adenylyltransferase [Desulfatirhabdium butyrativorans]
MRIALFGGSFDPIHCGHLTAARRMIERCGMDRIVLIPAALPPHKRGRQIASVADRRAMIDLAIGSDPDILVSDIEILREGPSYTIDTIENLLAAYPCTDSLYLAMGSDAFVELDTWRDWERIPALVSILVLKRPSVETPGNLVDDRVERYLRDVLGYGAPEQGGAQPEVWHHRVWLPVRVAAIDAMHVSSSDIRQRIRNGESIRDLVPPAVERYIAEKGLYRP